MKFATIMLLATVSAVRLTQKQGPSAKRAAAEAISHIDTDGDNQINRAELAAFVEANAEALDLPTDAAFWDAEFTAADADNSGSVD